MKITGIVFFWGASFELGNYRFFSDTLFEPVTNFIPQIFIGNHFLLGNEFLNVPIHLPVCQILFSDSVP